MGLRIPGEWTDRDNFIADDGRRFTIFSEHVRGEPRLYYVKENVSASDDGWPDYVKLPFDGAYRRSTVQAHVHAYVQQTASAQGAT